MVGGVGGRTEKIVFEDLRLNIGIGEILRIDGDGLIVGVGVRVVRVVVALEAQRDSVGNGLAVGGDAAGAAASTKSATGGNRTHAELKTGDALWGDLSGEGAANGAGEGARSGTVGGLAVGFRRGSKAETAAATEFVDQAGANATTEADVAGGADVEPGVGVVVEGIVADIEAELDAVVGAGAGGGESGFGDDGFVGDVAVAVVNAECGIGESGASEVDAAGGIACDSAQIKELFSLRRAGEFGGVAEAANVVATIVENLDEPFGGEGGEGELAAGESDNGGGRDNAEATEEQTIGRENFD